MSEKKAVIRRFCTDVFAVEKINIAALDHH